jgi:hypothetical protein
VAPAGVEVVAGEAIGLPPRERHAVGRLERAPVARDLLEPGGDRVLRLRLGDTGLGGAAAEPPEDPGDERDDEHDHEGEEHGVVEGAEREADGGLEE